MKSETKAHASDKAAVMPFAFFHNGSLSAILPLLFLRALLCSLFFSTRLPLGAPRQAYALT